MKEYICFITCMLSSYEDGIVADLCKKGYTVKSASKNNNISYIHEKCSCAMIVVIVNNPHKDVSLDIAKDIGEIMENRGYYYYSAVCNLLTNGNAGFIMGNIILNKNSDISSNHPYR